MFSWGLWIGLRSAWLQMWAESWSACQPLYGNGEGQSKGLLARNSAVFFLQRAATSSLLFLLLLVKSTYLYCLVFASYCLDIFDPPVMPYLETWYLKLTLSFFRYYLAITIWNSAITLQLLTIFLAVVPVKSCCGNILGALFCFYLQIKWVR